MSDLDFLQPRIRGILAAHGITTLQQVAQAYPRGLLDIRGVGYKTLRLVEARVPGQPHYTPKPEDWAPGCQCELCAYKPP